jgi:flagellar hook-associated protein 1
MSGLLGLLDLGSGAILAQNAGVSVAGRNLANVNTAGYSDETVTLESQLAAPLVGGVSVGDPTRASSSLLSAQARSSAGESGSSGALSTALTNLETDLTQTSQGISSSMASFFGDLSSLEAAPTDPALRTTVVADAQNVATAFSQASSAISQAQDDSDSRITSDAQTATQLAAQIAAANKTLQTDPDPTIADQRDLAAQQLAALVGGAARVDSDGQMRFVLANGAVMVDGTTSSTMTATPDATLGNHVRVDVVEGNLVTNVTDGLDGGSIAGEISFRDGTAATAATNIDQLAYDFSTQVNAIHSANAGLDGVTGRDLFTQPTAVTGAAANMAVSAAIVADPSELAAAAPGAGSSDNTGATALVALSTQLLAAGGTATFSDQAINTIANVGAAAQSATNANNLATARATVVANAQDSLSGVSTDQEMANLTKFQQASEAATRFVSTVSQMLSDFIENV